VSGPAAEHGGAPALRGRDRAQARQSTGETGHSHSFTCFQFDCGLLQAAEVVRHPAGAVASVAVAELVGAASEAEEEAVAALAEAGR
jgi:hypothetical protein